jgi:hypothetical protein
LRKLSTLGSSARIMAMRGAGRGWLRRASGTVRARLAAIVTRRWRRTNVPPSAGPPPAVAGEGGRVARAAQCVLVSLRSRLVSGTWCCLAVRPSASAAGEGDCRARTALDVPVSHECDAPAVSHVVWPCCAALRQRGWGHVQPVGRGRGGRSSRVRCAGCTGLAVMATRRWRHTDVRPGGPPPAVAGEGGRVARDARGVQVLPRS